ncbi:MAG: pilus assembly protein PilZ [Spirochaetes bacterium]|nr:pilus assembly protein PilZ [Spirochaetota bacterium]
MTSKKIKDYYERYKDIDVTYTKEVAFVTRLLIEQVHVKCGHDAWPCTLFSSSFAKAKILINIKTGLLNQLKNVNNAVSLRFCFQPAEKGTPIKFFVPSKVTGQAPYRGSEEVYVLSLDFTQRPPDDLIAIMGQLIDANVNFAKRKTEQVPLTEEKLRKLRLVSRNTLTYIQEIPRQCILQEISFCSAKLITVGLSKFLQDKDAAVRFEFDDPPENFILKGQISNVEPLPNKKEMAVITLSYNESSISMGYKIRLNEFLVAIRADNRPSNEDSDGAAKKKP